MKLELERSKEYLGNVPKKPERGKSAERVLGKCTKKA